MGILELPEIRSLPNYGEINCRRTALLYEAVTSRPISTGSPLGVEELEHVYNRSPV